ncbi:hypothetical protein SADUNF_Sadunf09G0100700 [Salix dunnii]|uniref:Squalene synthase n=1 Tax=Salix dunnii TaxID=1413687 RepID=A0A835JYE2_9ROSI|nr:hypothetical protein SADUNF_Sadunf09G0100700 [Salix dunnii]
MGSLGEILKHPDDLYPLLKLKMAARHAEKQIPCEPHWVSCYSMLHRVSRSFAPVIQQLGTELRNAVCIFYLVLRALDTVEDDTSIPPDVKVPILIAFHRHIYDRDWHFSCGTKDYKVLMDQFHDVSTAFLELGKGYQEAIEDTTRRMGAGMAKFICKELETIADYDEYCHYAAGLVGLGLSKLFNASDLASDRLSSSLGLLLQKTNVIRDYLEDINEIPKSRMFWPREIWSKYVNKLEDLKNEENSVKAVQCLNDMVTNSLIHVNDCLKYLSALREPAIFRFSAIPQVETIGDYDEYCHYVAGLVGMGLSKLFNASGLEDLASDSISNSMGLFLQDLKNEENSVKAVQCLNDMVTNSLIHVDDCLKYMSALQEPGIFRFCAIPQVMAIGTLALCYNNINVFKGVVKMRRGLTAQIIHRTKTMADVYGAFFDFSCMLKSKVDKNDPNAAKTLSSLEAIQKTCRESGALNKRKSCIIRNELKYNFVLVSSAKLSTGFPRVALLQLCCSKQFFYFHLHLSSSSLYCLLFLLLSLQTDQVTRDGRFLELPSVHVDMMAGWLAAQVPATA